MPSVALDRELGSILREIAQNERLRDGSNTKNHLWVCTEGAARISVSTWELTSGEEGEKQSISLAKDAYEHLTGCGHTKSKGTGWVALHTAAGRVLTLNLQGTDRWEGWGSRWEYPAPHGLLCSAMPNSVQEATGMSQCCKRKMDKLLHLALQNEAWEGLWLFSINTSRG